jgi:hypothetical protein
MGFFKRHKVWSVFIGIIVVLIVAFVGVVGYQAIKVRVMSVQTERHYVAYMKGVWEPAATMLMGAKDIERMKEDNMNVVSLGPSFDFLSETNIIGLIKEAKNQGMAVHVAPQAVGGFGGDPDAVTEEKLAKWSEMVLHWAEKCEEYGVEYFSPLNEADLALHRDRAIE